MGCLCCFLVQQDSRELSKIFGRRMKMVETILFYMLYIVLQKATPLHPQDFYVERIKEIHDEYDNISPIEEARAVLLFDLIKESCQRFGIPLEIGLALCKTESDFINPLGDGNGRGRYGEYGYFQIKAATALWMAKYWKLPEIRKKIKRDPAILFYSPQINILLGVSFLKYNLLQSKGDYKKAIIAYNRDHDYGQNYFERFIKSLKYFIDDR